MSTVDVSKITCAVTDDELYDIFNDPSKKAKNMGCTLRFPRPNELFIDVDTHEQADKVREQVKMFERSGSDVCIDFCSSPSKSGPPHYHIVLSFFKASCCRVPKKELPPYEFKSEWERICLQFFFCSDFKRECLNTLRLLQGGTSMNCFFEQELLQNETATSNITE